MPAMKLETTDVDLDFKAIVEKPVIDPAMLEAEVRRLRVDLHHARLERDEALRLLDDTRRRVNEHQRSLDAATELKQRIKWRPGPAQGVEVPAYDSDEFFVAVRVREKREDGGHHEYWQYDHINVGVDEDGTMDADNLDDSWGWDWSNVGWYVPIEEITPPMPEEEPAK